MRVTEQTEAARWDARLRESGGHPLQAWAWGALKERFGWQAHRLWTDDGRAAAQLLIRPYRGIGAAYVPRGPLLSGEPAAAGDPATNADAATDAALLDALQGLARRRRAAFLRLEPDVMAGSPAEKSLDSALTGRGFRAVQRTLQPRASVRLDLAGSDDELRRGLSKGHRADVRRAEKADVEVRRGASEADVDLLHAMMRATQARKTFGIHSAAYYRAAWRLYGDDALLLLARHDGAVVAASLVLSFGRQAVYLAAGSSPAGLQVRASHLLQWHALRWARDHGAQTYDLWGIPDARGRLELAGTPAGDEGDTADGPRAALERAAAADPLDGVFRFKKGWGGEVVRSVPAYDRVFFPPAYWFWRWRGQSL
ncbi:MAG TPA: peptidoglycan bridge formation glycyltransferase FemA/FemB family protein [Candidatus Limnocylindria bacterium]|nr:peptidoglycan bridge formation glycyltransferase FemA/FemB family protein [Candidatus Limnocylindria bacterium]